MASAELRRFYQTVARQAGEQTLKDIADATGDEQLSRIIEAMLAAEYTGGSPREIARQIGQASQQELAELTTAAMQAAAEKTAQEISKKSSGILIRIIDWFKGLF